MKFYISYFYAVRFMKPNTVALSTAMWDPKWFYNKHQGDVYLDKRGVLNGLRLSLLCLKTIKRAKVTAGIAIMTTLNVALCSIIESN